MREQWLVRTGLLIALAIAAASAPIGQREAAARAMGATQLQVSRALDPVSGPFPTWRIQATHSMEDLRGIYCMGVRSCLVGGGDGILLAGPSGTGTWSSRVSGAAKGDLLLSVACAGGSRCVAVGDVTAVSADGGQRWRARKSNNGMSGVTCPSTSVCLAVGVGGDIEVSANGGVSWSSRHSGVTDSLQAVSCATSTTCVAVGENGDIVVTTNSGTTWHSQPSGTSNTLFDVRCPSSKLCLAVGDKGTILRNTGGMQWKSVASGASEYLEGVACATNSICVAVGAVGTILVSATAGQTWSTRSAGVESYLRSVSCPSIGTCLVAGSGGTILAGP